MAERPAGPAGERRKSAEVIRLAAMEPAAAEAVQRARLAIGVAQTPREVIDIVIVLVRALGAEIAPVGVAPEHALPDNLTLDVDEAMLAVADPGSAAWRDLRMVLPTFLDEARRIVLELRQRALRQDPATTDSVTGLINRAAFDDQLRQLAPGDAIALVRLHHLELLTDNVGERATEATLVTFARLLTDHLRPSDLAARYSSDTFGLALPGISVQLLAHRLELIRQAWNGLRPYAMPLSVGLATLSSVPEAALRQAADAVEGAVRDHTEE